MKRFVSAFLLIVFSLSIQPVQAYEGKTGSAKAEYIDTASLATLANWIDSKENNGIAYFLMAATKSLRRYDMRSGWSKNLWPDIGNIFY